MCGNIPLYAGKNCYCYVGTLHETRICTVPGVPQYKKAMLWAIEQVYLLNPLINAPEMTKCVFWHNAVILKPVTYFLANTKG